MTTGNKIVIGLFAAFGLGLALAWAGYWIGLLLCVPGAIAGLVVLKLDAILDRIADTLKGVRIP